MDNGFALMRSAGWLLGRETKTIGLARSWVAAAVLAAAAVAVSGCATSPSHTVTIASAPPPAAAPVAPTRPTVVTVDTAAAEQPKVIRITPLTRFASSFATYPSARFSDTYTRLIVTSIVAGDATKSEPTEYNYGSRNALQRFLFGTHHTINMTAKVTVGSFTATVPLVTISHVSNSTDGEAFTRTVYHLAANYPLFLVKGDGSNSIVSMQFSVKASDQYQSGAAALIQTAQTVIKAVAPQSAVLTTLTEQSTKDVAAALDTTIGKLLATSIDEEPWADNDIRQWANGASVTFSIPPQEGAWDQTNTFLEIGTWTVTFADPRPSIFSDVQICAPSSTSLDSSGCEKDFATAARKAQDGSLRRPEEVLAFPLVNGTQALGTVAAYLKQQDFWTTAQKAFQTAGGPKADDVSQFCRSVRNSIVGLNLNSVDAGIVIVAVRKSSTFAKTVSDAMEKDKENCNFAL